MKSNRKFNRAGALVLLVAKRAAAVAVAAVLILSSCHSEHGGEPEHIELDLVEELAAAEVRRETGRIDLGAPEARRHLVSGWSWDESSDDGGMTFVWSRGGVSTLEFFLVVPRELRLTFRCSPLLFSGAPEQAVTFGFGDRSSTEVVLGGGMREYTVIVPESALVAGRNLWSLSYRYTAIPLEVSSSADSRRLAVAWDWLDLEPVPEHGESPRADPQRRALFLPYGTELGYYLDLGARGRLNLDGVAMRGSGEGRLLVSIREEGSSEQALDTIDRSIGSRSVELPGDGSRLVRLGLRAVPADPGAATSGGVTLTAPEVRSAIPRPAPPRVEEQRLEKPARRPRPNIIVFVIDTLRADRLGCYGGPHQLSPNIDAFASQAILFERVVAQSSWTKPAVASLLTGLMPMVHGVQSVDTGLPPAAKTLPEILQAAGYLTAAFSTNPHISPASGFAQGVDDFRLLPPNLPSDAVVEEVGAWIGDRIGEAPFFLYVHTMDPHAPYDPPAELRQRFAKEVVRQGAGTLEDLQQIFDAPRGEARKALLADLPPLYDAEVAFSDRSFGALLDILRAESLFDDALIVLLSDHGEEFGEHGSLSHANHLYSEVLDVPLIVKPSGWQTPQRVAALAQHVDLLPTLASYLGLDVEEDASLAISHGGLPGVDLLRLARQEAARSFRGPAFDGQSVASRAAFSHMHSYQREGISVVHGVWKLIEPLNSAFGSRPELFHTIRDPGDQVDVLDRHPVRSGYLAWLIRRERSRNSQQLTAGHVEIDEATRRSLRALGYLE